MGYERKRGKLGDLNALLRGGSRGHFSLIVGETAVLSAVKYVITLDTDTQLPRDAARLSLLEQDAASFVAEPQRADSVQVLCVDLYDHEAAAPVLDSEDFYADCRRILSDDGVMSVNLFGRNASLARSVQHIAAVFGAIQVRTMQPTREGNSIVVALKSEPFPTQSMLAARAQNIETRFHLPARKWLRMIRPLAPTAHPSPEPEPASE